MLSEGGAAAALEGGSQAGRRWPSGTSNRNHGHPLRRPPRRASRRVARGRQARRGIGLQVLDRLVCEHV